MHPSVPEFEEIEYAPRDTARLAHKFKKAGLQVIVKMTSIELTPEKPEFSAEEWHVRKKCSHPDFMPIYSTPPGFYINMANVRLRDR